MSLSIHNFKSLLGSKQLRLLADPAANISHLVPKDTNSSLVFGAFKL